MHKYSSALSMLVAQPPPWNLTPCSHVRTAKIEKKIGNVPRHILAARPTLFAMMIFISFCYQGNSFIHLRNTVVLLLGAR